MNSVITFMVCLLSITTIFTSTNAFYTCPSGWSLFNKKCFLLGPNGVTWHQADHFCTSKNSSLVKVDSLTKRNSVKEFLTGSYTWIALRDEFKTGDFRWNDGSALNFTSWASGEPNNASENCAVMRKNGNTYSQKRWYDRYCNNKYRFICKKAGRGKPCETGWFPLMGQCYNISNSRLTVTWENARKICQSNDSDLVVITSKEENNYLANKLTSSYSYFWIGLNDIQKEGQWRWLDDRAEARVTFWSINEPNNANNQLKHCGFMYGSSWKRGKWGIASCGVSKPFICEKTKCERPNQNVSTTVSPDGQKWQFYHRSDRDRCYLVNRATLMNWHQARKYCQNIGGDLPTIKSYTDMSLVKGLLNSYMDSWMGLNDLKSMREWRWLDSNYKLNYTYWYNNREPSSIDYGQMCVAMHTIPTARGKWFTDSCSTYNTYICKTTAVNACLKNSSWIHHGKYCYSFNFDKHNWQTSHNFCRTMWNISSLLTIDDNEEQEFINSKLKNRTDTIWIGLSQLNHTGIFYWLNTTVKPKITNWAPQEPNLLRSESCVRTDSWQGLWGDDMCDKRYRPMCEIDAKGDSTYYDYRHNGSIFKITDAIASKDAANKLCEKLLGPGASIPVINSEDDVKRLEVETFQRRHSTRMYEHQKVWVQQGPNTNLSFAQFGTIFKLAGTSRRLPTRAQVINKPNTECLMIAPNRRYGSIRYQFKYQFYRVPCCQQFFVICQRKETVDQLENGYDFQRNNSVYRIMTNESVSQPEAEIRCRRLMDGDGTLLRVDSKEELVFVSSELKARHTGASFDYWIGGDPNNSTYNNFVKSPTKDDLCLILTHKDFSTITWSSEMFELLPSSKCNQQKFYICERDLGSKEEEEFYDLVESIINQNQPGALMLTLPEQRSCTNSACIGLAVAFPFAVIATIAITVLLMTYNRTGFRRRWVDTMYRKQADQVFLDP